MDLFEAKAAIPRSDVEAIDAVLLERGGTDWMLQEDVIAGSAWVSGIFPDEAHARRSWAELRVEAHELEEFDLKITRLADSDWRDSYKAHFKAWRFGRLHWVPVWERGTFHAPLGEHVLWLDPGLAFGTGNHETTRLCVERLVRLSRVGDRVIDIGCGAGILGLSAALLGHREVVGFDNDASAVEVSRENAALNGLSDRVHFFHGALPDALGGLQAELLLANVQADILMLFADALLAAVAAGGVLVLSGILASELEAVRAVFSARTPGWAGESRVLGEWSDLQLRRPLR